MLVPSFAVTNSVMAGKLRVWSRKASEVEHERLAIHWRRERLSWRRGRSVRRTWTGRPGRCPRVGDLQYRSPLPLDPRTRDGCSGHDRFGARAHGGLAV